MLMYDASSMRTTLEIDDDVLLAAKSLSQQRGVPAGKVLSELARKGLHRNRALRMRNGAPLFPTRPGSSLVTLELVNRLRNEAP